MTKSASYATPGYTLPISNRSFITLFRMETSIFGRAWNGWFAPRNALALLKPDQLGRQAEQVIGADGSHDCHRLRHKATIWIRSQ